MNPYQAKALLPKIIILVFAVSTVQKMTFLPIELNSFIKVLP